MGFLFFFIHFFSIGFPLLSAASSFTEFVYPNFTASNINFVDGGGTFLFSSSRKFKAAVFNPGSQRTRFYLCVIHVASNTIIWSANRDSPISESGTVALTTDGITISDGSKSQRWSTPRLRSLVSSLQLSEAGNLVLLDWSNATLWESFGNPTDTIVTGQRLHSSAVLSSAVSGDDLSTGCYSLSLTSSDAVLQWENLAYWKLSMDVGAYLNSNHDVEFLTINQTGLYLFGQNGSTVVVSVNFPPADFRMATIDGSGQLVVSSFSGGSPTNDCIGPTNKCRVPFICGKIGLCSSDVSVYSYGCSCPSGFERSSVQATNCVPSDASLSLPISCNSSSDRNSSNSSANVSYLPFDDGIDYFQNDFNPPAAFGLNLSLCEDLCSKDCDCLGIFYKNSSGSCYTIKNKIGSVMLRPKNNGRLGFIKTVARSSLPGHARSKKDDGNMGFPAASVILPSIAAVVFILAVGFLLWRRFTRLGVARKTTSCSCTHSFSSSFDDTQFSIPGLPRRFSYLELQAATLNFKMKIGTGGYGTVYRGSLLDKTPVAVKRLNKAGPQGQKDFCTEVAVISSIHHVNLVKLKGFCIDQNEWLLVYEYMSGGSLGRALFGDGPILEWAERARIAVGAARGLAYLHSGCEPKVVHCDVKPENILLDSSRSRAKISDFGLARFLRPEDSGMLATMRGTRGYLAPEWLTTSTVSEKTDVYSFGMVLLEIVSGRKNCRPSTDDGVFFFPVHALDMHEEGRYVELVDPRLRDRVRGEEVRKLVRVALCCVDLEPMWRPSMVNVVGMLEGEMSVGEPRREGLEFLRLYGRPNEASVVNVVGQDIATWRDEEMVERRRVSDMDHSDMSSEQVSGPR